MGSSAAPAASSRQRRSAHLAAAHWIAQSHPAGLVHGAVAMGAILAVIGGHEAPWGWLAAGMLGALSVYWLTHAYTHALGIGVAGDQRRLVRRLLQSARLESAVLIGGLPALVAFVLAMQLGAKPPDAIDVALWVTLTLLGVVGYLAGHLAGITGWRLVGETMFAVWVGGCMVTLNTLLH
jgi:hypothetical protein